MNKNDTQPSGRRMLVIDDNPAIHVDFRKIFSPDSADLAALDAAEDALFGAAPAADAQDVYLIDSAFQGEEALDLVRRSLEEKNPYAMAFVDVRMPPGWDGIETVYRIWQEYPDLQVVICTAYSDYSLEEIIGKLGKSDRFVILKKPFDNIEVLQLGHAMTEKWFLLQETKSKTEELERRVAERTRELEMANQKLQDEIAERAKVEESLRHVQKMEALGRLTGGVAHEFNNIIAIIRGYTSFLMAGNDFDEESEGFLLEVDTASERAANLTRQLLTFSRKQVMQPESLDPNEILGQIARMLQPILGEDIALDIQAADAVPLIWADRAMMENVLLNLALNARDAMPNGGLLLITTSTVELTEAAAVSRPGARAGQFACICVRDSGCGIAPEIMQRLFEPFFTTKEVGRGTGLGLATAYGIVQHHKGWIEVQSAPGQGATFRIFLPATSRPLVVPTAGATPESQPRGGKETILLVEDEAALRNIARRVLEGYGYRVYTAESGVDALKIWPDIAAEIDLLVTDMVMPGGISGGNLAARLQAEKSGLKIIYSSGYSPELTRGDAVLHEGINFLQKPYSPRKLAKVVRGCLDGVSSAPHVAAGIS